jgi:hypothetical protein
MPLNPWHVTGLIHDELKECMQWRFAYGNQQRKGLGRVLVLTDLIIISKTDSIHSNKYFKSGILRHVTQGKCAYYYYQPISTIMYYIESLIMTHVHEL